MILWLNVLCALLLSPASADVLRDRQGWTSYLNMRYVTSFASDGPVVYVGTTGGVGRYDRYRRHWLEPLTMSDGLLDNEVKRIAYDPATGDMWFETRRGVSRWQTTGNYWYTEPTFPTALINGREHRVELPELFMSFGYFFFPEGYIRDRHLRRFTLTDRFVDDWNTLWIGTWGAGAGKADLRSRQLEMLPFGLIEDDVAAMALDDGAIWFGGVGDVEEAKGISRFDLQSGEWTYFEAKLTDGLKSANVTAIVPDGRYVWFGTSYGVSRYDRRGQSWAGFTSFDGLSDNNVLDLCRDGEILWVGTAFGLNTLTPLPGGERPGEVLISRVEAEGLKSLIIYDVEADDRHVWVGTNRGVYRYVKAEGRWEPFAGASGMSASAVTSIALEEGRGDSGGAPEERRIWLGGVPSSASGVTLNAKITEEGTMLTIPPPILAFGGPPGAFFLVSYDEKTGEWKQYLPPIGLGGGLFYLWAGPKAVWLATASGALKLNPEIGTWRLYTEDDGLPDNTVQTILPDGDYVWFGTEKGAARFHWNDPFRGE